VATPGAPAVVPDAVPTAPRPVAIAPVACPHCGSMNSADNLFCESCGYDFTTGQVPDPVLTPPPAPAAPAPTSTWVVVVEVDPAWFALKGELADHPLPPPSTSTVSLRQHVSLVGRTSHSRGLHPEIALDTDSAVSRRHAQLVVEGDQLSVVDLSSTNGTYVVGAGEAPVAETHPISPGVPAVLDDGDHILLGAWTRLTVRRGSPT